MSTTATVYRAWNQFTHLLLGQCDWRNGDIEIHRSYHRIDGNRQQYKVAYTTHIDVFEGSHRLWEQAMEIAQDVEERATWILWLYFALATINSTQNIQNKVTVEEALGCLRMLAVINWSDKACYDSFFNMFYYFRAHVLANSPQYQHMSKMVSDCHLIKVTSYNKFIPRSLEEVVHGHVRRKKTVTDYKKQIENWWRLGCILDICGSDAAFEALRKTFNQQGIIWSHRVSPPKMGSL